VTKIVQAINKTQPSVSTGASGASENETCLPS